MESLLETLAFFAGPRGPLILGIVTALIIVVWEWRVALLGLFCVQVGVVSAAVALEQVPAEWASVMVVIMALACLILALSAYQMTRTTTLNQSGTWPLRALLLVLLYIGWALAEVNLPLPGVNPELADLFVWLALCMVVILGLSDNPLFGSVGLLLWLIPVQVIAAVIVNSPVLVALIGMVSLLLALAGSYLILAEQVEAEADAPIVTDIAFPENRAIPAAGTFQPESAESWIEQWFQRWSRAWLARTRQIITRRR